MNTDEDQTQSDEGNADQGSGDRPEHPKDATSPPGNPDVDEAKVEKAEEEAEQTKPY